MGVYLQPKETAPWLQTEKLRVDGEEVRLEKGVKKERKILSPKYISLRENGEGEKRGDI